MSRSEGGGSGEPRHGVRIAVIWAVLTVVLTPVVVIVIGPHLPPGKATTQATDQTTTNTVLTGMVTPVVLLILVYFGYALVVFRARGDLIEDGPPIRGHAPTQTFWIAGTAAIVLFLAGYGTFTLLGPGHGSGGGQGPVPLSVPAGKKLQVQVIAQQWAFTYRFPQFGGVETFHLEVPVNQVVELHVTSLDVVHSWWAIELGVKADAVPGADNVAFVTPTRVQTFQIRCAELCGLFHGQMFDTGRVVTASTFQTWIAGQEKQNADITAMLGPFRRMYFPDPQRRAG